MTEDRGERIAYTVLVEGTRVEGSDGEEVGTLKRVLADEASDIFDGLILDTPDGDRFVDAPQVGDIYTRVVILTIRSDAAAELPEHTPSPAVVALDADTIAGADPGGTKSTARKVWDRLSGNY